MSDPDFDFSAVSCPMPDCGSPLYLEWHLGYRLAVGDLASGDGIEVQHADSAEWGVTCEDGHTVLVPGRTGCPCGDLDLATCEHAAELYDWSEDLRTFQPHDAQRLRALIEELKGARA